jgi:23S rRNA (uracil1939-C5)-methyltransferase
LAALAAGKFFRKFGRSSRPAELALFSNAQEDSLLASVFTSGTAQVPLTDYFDALLQEVPLVSGVELAEQHQGQLPRTIVQAGDLSLNYHAAGFRYRVDHGAFFQVNRWLLDKLVECVTDGHQGELAWDLFAGVGLFARRLAERFSRVVAVESAPAAMAALTQNLAGTSATSVNATTLDFLRSALKAERPDPIVPDLIVPDLIVVDPPRTGLGAEVTLLLGQIAAPAMVYVSCDPATLARDLRALIGAGYGIEHVTLADLFPQTFHLETVVRLRRQTG